MLRLVAHLHLLLDLLLHLLEHLLSLGLLVQLLEGFNVAGAVGSLVLATESSVRSKVEPSVALASKALEVVLALAHAETLTKVIVLAELLLPKAVALKCSLVEVVSLAVAHLLASLVEALTELAVLTKALYSKIALTVALALHALVGSLGLAVLEHQLT